MNLFANEMGNFEGKANWKHVETVSTATDVIFKRENAQNLLAHSLEICIERC